MTSLPPSKTKKACSNCKRFKGWDKPCVEIDSPGAGDQLRIIPAKRSRPCLKEKGWFRKGKPLTDWWEPKE